MAGIFHTRAAPLGQAYWWDGAPPAAGPEGEPPDKVDILIVGAGYTGLAAAISAKPAIR